MRPNRPATRHALLLGLLIPCALHAQGPSPVPPPGDSIVHEAIRLLQSGDPAARGAFIARTFSTAALKDSARHDRFLAELHAQGAPFELAELTRHGRNALPRLVSRRTGRVATLQIASDRTDPTRIGYLGILEAHPALLDSVEWKRPAAASDTQLAAIVDANVSRLAAAGVYAGVVHVESRNGVVLSKGYGLANREDSVPNTPRTRFALASMGKMFTAVAVMQLVEQGRLRLDDTLARVLPAYPNAERAARITIRQLLEHTAGLGDQWSTPRRPVPGLTGTLATVAAVAHAPLLFDPGTRWSYSNEGYNVLAAVVEQVTGRPFVEYVQREVLDRAGMTETVLAGSAELVIPRRAVGYRNVPEDHLGVLPQRANWLFVGNATFGGAGGGYSTAGDLAKFGRAMREGRLVGPALRDSMWVGRWDIPGYDGQRYGWGTFVHPAGGRVAVGHGGGGTGSGMDNGFRHFTDGSYTIVVLGNVDPPAATRITNGIVALLGQ